MTTYKQVLQRLEEFGADYLSQMAYLSELRQRCKDGIPNEKATPKGAVEILEKFPALELSATRLMIDVYQHVEALAAQEVSDTELNITIVRAYPETTS